MTHYKSTEELVKQLRAGVEWAESGPGGPDGLTNEAADTIERLQYQLEVEIKSRQEREQNDHTS